MNARTLLLLSIVVAPAGASELVVNSTTDAVGMGCTPLSCTLRDAIASASASGGDVITFDLPLPATITLQSGAGLGELVIDRPVAIDGPGAASLRIEGSGWNRVVEISSGPVTISGVQIAHGLVGDPHAPGANAAGGCVSITSSGSLVLDGVDVRDCTARGTAGASGSTVGASGFSGGYAIGGGIYSTGALTIVRSSITASAAIAGDGGRGADGNTGSGGSYGPGSGGSGGTAAGGAIFVDGAGSLSLRNATIALSGASGGEGGDAGNDALDSASGGNGGLGVGGNIFVSDSALSATIAFSTVAQGAAQGGEGGNGTLGDVAQSGSQFGSDLFGNGPINMLSSVVSGPQDAMTSLCSGAVVESRGSMNIDDDGSCGFALMGAAFRPFDAAAILPSYMPAWQSAEIDRARSCNDADGNPVTEDQNGTPRPQGSQCDIGAVETDYVFAAAFE